VWPPDGEAQVESDLREAGEDRAMPRNHKEEYDRRVTRGEALGLSRSQARGHARWGEKPVNSKQVVSDHKLERALRTLRVNGNQAKAAKAAGLSVERFRRFLRENQLAERHGRKWRMTDARPRQIEIISTRGERQITVPGFDAASLGMRHRAAVERFLKSNDLAQIQPFVGASVLDTRGRTHVLETRPNYLYRLIPREDGIDIYHLTASP
jgi:hypothetical protein